MTTAIIMERGDLILTLCLLGNLDAFVLSTDFFKINFFHTIRVSNGPRREKTCHSGFPTKRVSNQSPQLQRLARKLKVYL